MDTTPTIRSTQTAEHYTWGGICDGWFLVKSPDISIIQERVPPGGAEVRHYHARAWQFFFVLHGQATLEIANTICLLHPQQGLEIGANTVHQLRNDGVDELIFLVVSRPHSHGDRVVVE